MCGVASANVPASEDSNRPHERAPSPPERTIDFATPDPYLEWHVIDRATGRSIDRVDEPDLALTHLAVVTGTAYVVEATVEARIVRHRIVTEDTIGEDA